MKTVEIKNYRKRKINLFCLNWLPIFVFLETVTIQIKYSSSPNGEWEFTYIITNTVYGGFNVYEKFFKRHACCNVIKVDVVSYYT